MVAGASHIRGYGIALIACLVVPALSGCTVERALTIDASHTPDNKVQNWSDEEREFWITATQGSRLIPLAWYKALEQAKSKNLFADPAHLVRFNYPLRSESPGLPMGFAIDQQADDAFKQTRLRWYAAQRGSTNSTSEPWLGMTCSACHLGRIQYQGESQFIFGGPSMGDFQSFISELDDAAVATRRDPGKWKRFNRRLLKDRDSPENRELLETAFDQFLDWQLQSQRTNQTSIQYGFGRVDALGRLYNKAAQFVGSKNFAGNPPSAPVSYPFLWEVYKQKYVQWNASARNTTVWKPNPRSPDVGAYGRNAGQVIGVFGEIVPRRLGSAKASSLNTDNLIRFEQQITTLQAPAWPSYFPSIDREMAQRGKALYATHCQECHKTKATQKKGKPTERVVLFRETQARHQTDIHMACNAYSYKVPTGLLAGTFNPAAKRNFRSREPGYDVLHEMVRQEVTHNLGQVFGGAASRVIESLFVSEVKTTSRFKRVRYSQAESACLTAADSSLGYKARPLDGIWATAPYLHNGSVPTLYDLLLPANQRPSRFYLGTREYDPNKVGFVTRPGNGNRFLFRANQPRLGNGNGGHEYGLDALTEDGRLDLLEYLKTL